MLTPGESVFVDTNVILYSVDAQSPVKRQQALSWLNFLWQSGQGRLSWQALHEFYANAVRKAGLPVAQSHRPGRSLRFSPGDATRRRYGNRGAGMVLDGPGADFLVGQPDPRGSGKAGMRVSADRGFSDRTSLWRRSRDQSFPNGTAQAGSNGSARLASHSNRSAVVGSIPVARRAGT